MLGQILVNFIVILVGVNLVPSVANTTAGVTGATGTNVTGASAAILDLVPLFFILGIAVTTIQSSVAILARMGF